MVQRLDSTAQDFDARFDALVADRREPAVDVDDAVATIIATVRARGDDALFELTAKYDRLDLSHETLRVGNAEIAAARHNCDDKVVKALELAHERILSHHRRQRPDDQRYTDPQGVTLGHRWTAVGSAGLYVPGGTASYPSSVLMNAVPAKVAGVARLVMVVPCPGGTLNPLVLAAAEIAGIDEIYRIGGAQAIAALAWGTQTIAPVDKIVGPGNAYVAAAKRQVFGTVGIDMVAGPSEVLIVADGDNEPDWVAADLLAQAEHDSAAQSILITDDRTFADRVADAVVHALERLGRRDIAQASWQRHGAIITLDRLSDAVRLIDRIAPEHLELQCASAEELCMAVRNAGAIFIGRYTPEAIGDYVGGSNHVLPTARSARFSSGLSVLDFMKRTTILECSEASLAEIGPAAITLGEAEGLDAHARSVAIRLNRRRGR